MRRKLYGSILVVGGGFAFQGVASMLQARLYVNLPAIFQKPQEAIEVSSNPRVSLHKISFTHTHTHSYTNTLIHKHTLTQTHSYTNTYVHAHKHTSYGMLPWVCLQDMDPTVVAWKGAAVLSCLDAIREMWIERDEWKMLGVRLLRERASFCW